MGESGEKKEKSVNVDRFRFRAWDKEEKRMIHIGELTETEHSLTNAISDRLEAIWEMKGGDKFIESFILMQCTGLKDSEGKLIWEGDIVQGKTIQGVWASEVFWDCKGGVFYFRDNFWETRSTFADSLSYEKVKVIGNIYEHPELLKESK